MYRNSGPLETHWKRLRCRTETLASMLLYPRMAIFSGEERGWWTKITEVQPRDFRTLWGLQNGLDPCLSQVLWLLPLLQGKTGALWL